MTEFFLLENNEYLSVEKIFHELDRNFSELM